VEVAHTMSTISMTSLNPLRSRGTTLAPNLLLAAKLIVLCWLLTGAWLLLPGPFLPYLPGFDHLASALWIHRILTTLFFVSALSLAFNRFVRASCIILGGVILLALLFSRPYFENNRLLCGSILFMIGLSERGHRKPWLLRLQIALVYLGAGLSKLLSPEWRSGQFFEFWKTVVLQQALYIKAASFFPQRLLFKLMSWGTIVTELSLAVAFLVPSLNTWAIWGGILFHTGLLIETSRSFGFFYCASLASYLAFIDWPESSLTVFYDRDCGFCNKARVLLKRWDVDDTFKWIIFHKSGISGPALQDKLQLIVGEKVYCGFAALKMVLLYNPITYFILCTVMIFPWEPAIRYRRWVGVSLLVLFSPPFELIGDAAYRAFAGNGYRLFFEKVWFRQN
jgi:hypothetical protein